MVELKRMTKNIKQLSKIHNRMAHVKWLNSETDNLNGKYDAQPFILKRQLKFNVETDNLCTFSLLYNSKIYQRAIASDATFTILQL